MNLKYIIIILALTTMASCTQNLEYNPLVVGKWTGSEWLILDKPSGMDATKVHFDFSADGTYNADFGNQHQKGTWHTEKDKLYTTEEGKKEIMVKMLQIDATTLKMEMNRGGQKETLTLGKQ